MSVSADEASRTLLALIDRIAASHHAVEIVSSNGRAVLMPADEYASWQETAYLFRSTKERPSSARRIRTGSHGLSRSSLTALRGRWRVPVSKTVTKEPRCRQPEK